MIVALIIAVAAIVGGSALALLPTRHPRVLGPIRTFGLTASVAVVLLHLLPEAYQARGGAALLVFAAALVAPSAFGPLMRLFTSASSDNSAEWVTLRVTYAGLLVHSAADGIALSAYSGHMHHGVAHYDVLIALSAHTVPVVAVMVLTFRDFRGLRFALFGALGLMLATCAGVIGAGLVPDEIVHGASAWVGAVIAGLLLHVVTHDLGGHPPRGHLERLFDLCAAGAGIGVGLLSGEAHSHIPESQSIGSSLKSALLDITVETAPMLLLGLIVAALLQSFGSRIPSAWLRPRGGLGSAVKGALVGLPFPLCSCSVLPISRVLGERRAAPPLVVAFLLAVPALGVETFALSVHFLGWQFAWLRLGGALLIAICGALAMGMLLSRPSALARPESLPLELGVAKHASMTRRILSAFDELFDHVGAWMVLGMIAAAFVGALVPPRITSGAASALVELLVVSVFALPAYVCAPATIPLAAALIAKGMSPGPVLVGILLGPVANLVALKFLRSVYGLRALVLGVIAIVVASWALAFVAHAAFAAQIVDFARAASAEPAWLGQVAALLLLGLLVRSIWRSGTRAWLAPMLSGKLQRKYGHTHLHPHLEEHAHGTAAHP